MKRSANTFISMFALVLVAAGHAERVSAAPTGRVAQAGQLMDLFGVAILEAQRQQTQKLWMAEPELRRYCIERALSREGANIAILVRQGVGPDHPRVQRIIETCLQFDPSKLRTHFACNVTDDSGIPVQTFCSEAFARSDDRRPVDAKAAIDLYFNGIGIEIIHTENAVGRRMRALRSQLAAFRSEAESLHRSGSELVRSEAEQLLQQLASVSVEPSPSVVESFSRALNHLKDLARAETFRLGELRKLDDLRVETQRWLDSHTSRDLRDKLDRIRLEHDTLAQESLPVQILSGLSAAQDQPLSSIGPSFDCAQARTPLSRIICSNADLSRLDIEVLQPYYTLRHLAPDDRERLRAIAIEYAQNIERDCSLNRVDLGRKHARQAAIACVTEHYQAQKRRWKTELGRFPRSAYEEAIRPIDHHVQAQADLKRLGFLAPDARVDGVYGAATRAAISAFQTARGLPVDGLMSDVTAQRLRAEATSAQMLRQSDRTFASIDPAILRDRVRKIEEQYRSLIAQLKEENLEQKKKREQEELERKKKQEQEELERKWTPRNKILRDGDLEDVIVLFNDTGRAPSVIKNLRGEVIFDGSRTLACQPHGGFQDVTHTRHVNALLAGRTPEMRFPLTRCQMQNLEDYDLVVISRANLLTERLNDLIPLLSALDEGRLAVLATISGREIESAKREEALKILEIENGVDHGMRRGYGMVVVMNGSQVICITDTIGRAAHERLIGRWSTRISEELGGRPTYVATDVDTAFRSAKRDGCGAIYATAEDLKLIKDALTRDKVQFRFLPLWNELSDVERVRRELEQEEERYWRDEEERRRKREGEEALRKEREKEEAEQRQRRQDELRQQFGAFARSFENLLAAEAKDFFEAPPHGNLSERGLRFQEKYPSIAQWYGAMLHDRWELVSVGTTLMDYGTAEFKGRTLEAAFARTTIRLRNRILGEYKDQCVITGFVLDKEFSMEREPVSATCDVAGEETIAKHRRGLSFVSRWFAR